MAPGKPRAFGAYAAQELEIGQVAIVLVSSSLVSVKDMLRFLVDFYSSVVFNVGSTAT